jgi:hypothetical protein
MPSPTIVRFRTGEVAARRLESILDIGFVLGLLGRSRITTLDVRHRQPAAEHETVLTPDAKAIAAPSEHLDVIVSLWALEHFGSWALR